MDAEPLVRPPLDWERGRKCFRGHDLIVGRFMTDCVFGCRIWNEGPPPYYELRPGVKPWWPQKPDR